MHPMADTARGCTAGLPSPIAIDGPAASGKSTIGRLLAGRFGYAFLDTGLMYRAFALAALRGGVPADTESCARLLERLALRLGDEQEARIYLDDEDVTDRLHDAEIERHVSAYASLPPVRAWMRERQREFARRGHTVLAGRDIGEVVLPDAALKIYLEADPAARARRRNAERGHEHEAAAAASHRELTRRDELDSPQTFVAPDAIHIDTTHLSLDEVFAAVLEHVPCAAG